jgi:hypothetical protein
MTHAQNVFHPMEVVYDMDASYFPAPEFQFYRLIDGISKGYLRKYLVSSPSLRHTDAGSGGAACSVSLCVLNVRSVYARFRASHLVVPCV